MAQSAELHKPGRMGAGAGRNPPVAGPTAGSPGDLRHWLARLSQDQTAVELWHHLGALKPARRRQWVEALAESGDGRARKLLAAALWDESAELALAAIAGLRALGDLSAAMSLERLGEISRIPRVAEAALAVAAAIRARGGAAGSAGLPEAAQEYWASFIDGDGAQLLMAVRPAGGARRRLAVTALSDQRGILDAWGADSVSRTEAEALRNAGSRRSPAGGSGAAAAGRGASGVVEERVEIGWIRVDGGYCAAAIDAALAIHRRDRRRLPGVWEFWQGDFVGMADGSVLTPAEGEPAERLRRRLAQTSTLIHFEGFRSWLLLGEDLAPFLPAVHEAMRQPEQAREERLASVISVCLATLFGARERRLWRARLLRQGALWERRGDRIVRELCLAAAWGLQEQGGVPAEQHPLLRAIARASLEVAVGIEDWNKTGG